MKAWQKEKTEKKNMQIILRRREVIEKYTVVKYLQVLL